MLTDFQIYFTDRFLGKLYVIYYSVLHLTLSMLLHYLAKFKNLK